MKLWHWLQRLVCNQIRSHGVWFGKRAVVGAVRVFEPTLGYVFLFSAALCVSLRPLRFK